MENKDRKIVIAFWGILIIILAVILAIIFNLNKDSKETINGEVIGTENSTEQAGSGETQPENSNVVDNQVNVNESSVNQESSQTGNNQSQNSQESDNGTVSGESNTANKSESSTSGNGDSSSNSDNTSSSAPTAQPGHAEIIDKADASYERWLAAAMVLGISMQYQDFDFKAIYLTGENTLENKSTSGGAYVVFTSGGQTYAVASKALDAERTAAGTMDLYTKDLGFNTFDIVSADSINTAGMTEVTIDDLSELINQSILVTIYEH